MPMHNVTLYDEPLLGYEYTESMKQKTDREGSTEVENKRAGIKKETNV